MEVSYFPRHSSGTPPFRLKFSPPFLFLNGRTTAWYSGYFANRPSSKRPGSLSKPLTRGTRTRKRTRTSSSIVTQLLLLRHPPNSTCTTPYDRKRVHNHNCKNIANIFSFLTPFGTIFCKDKEHCTRNSFYAHIAVKGHAR